MSLKKRKKERKKEKKKNQKHALPDMRSLVNTCPIAFSNEFFWGVRFGRERGFLSDSCRELVSNLGMGGCPVIFVRF